MEYTKEQLKRETKERGLTVVGTGTNHNKLKEDYERVLYWEEFNPKGNKRDLLVEYLNNRGVKIPTEGSGANGQVINNDLVELVLKEQKEFDLFELRERYLQYWVSDKTIQKRVDSTDRYLYKGQPILKEYDRSKYEVEKSYEEQDRLEEEIKKEHSRWSKRRIEEEVDRKLSGRKFINPYVFTWIYDLEKDKFLVFSETKEDEQRIDYLDQKRDIIHLNRNNSSSR